MKKQLIQLSLAVAVTTMSTLANETHVLKQKHNNITIEGIALNPEGIEYNKNDQTFLLSSLNAAPIVKVTMDGTYKPFTSGEKFPLSTAGLQIDHKRNRLLVAGFNGTEIMDKDPKTKGVSFLRIYNLKTGILENEINLSSLAPEATAYFANDIAVDAKGNAYITDWYAGLIYKVNIDGKASIFWKNTSGIAGGPNGIDFHPDGYLLVSIIKVNDKGIYEAHGLAKIPLDKPTASSVVTIADTAFGGFDGMVITPHGNVIGVTNNGKTGGGNTLIELSSKDNYKSAQVIRSKAITTSTTVALTPKNESYVINQDFSDNFKKTWTIEKIEF
jgi:sugar lactone lactonase YvrE